ncbi:aspartate/glutamate racemase family protein [Zunongwangia sp. HGR-M22]|uniref:aspartate/glutamate racemase family protein n=1 Tax=Zunongwangia sp. HGR-M22 TaxID=3015168 RepID=UPI0022DD7A6A|nr:aspartate/glutamate racemase family protein [Zunongwangia sp. HGR-M22]WBL24674.1 aspartate/glutamate racemase family protein [Zunongwangia sp. HGR-M22]
MSKKLALIHTSATLVSIFQELVEEYLKDKDIQIFNIVDDSLIKNTIERNKLTPDTARRVVNYIGSAEEAGADYIMVTCSSIGAAVESSEILTSVPVLRVDRPMADKAVSEGKKIGVVATLPTTLEPTSDLVRRRALAVGKEIELTSKLCEGAFEALMNGNAQEHDKKVAAALIELTDTVDVIVLAQASMARVVEQLDDIDRKVPILASPPVAMEYLVRIL